MKRNYAAALATTFTLALVGCGNGAERAEVSTQQTKVAYTDDAQLANESGCYMENITESSLDFICPDKDGEGDQRMVIRGNFIPDAQNSEFVNDGELSSAVSSVVAVDNSNKETDELTYEIRIFHNVNGAGCATVINEEGKISFDKCEDTDDIALKPRNAS